MLFFYIFAAMLTIRDFFQKQKKEILEFVYVYVHVCVCVCVCLTYIMMASEYNIACIQVSGSLPNI